MQKNSSQKSIRSMRSCHEDLILHAVGFLSVHDIGLAACSSKAFEAVCSSDALWEPLCAAYWATKESQYHLTPERRAALDAMDREDRLAARRLPPGHGGLPRALWRARYEAAERDGKRGYFLGPEELSAQTFDFRFRAHPDYAASLDFRFDLDSGRVMGHPNRLAYAWSLQDRGRTITLGLFPPARARRLESWGWALVNPNIVLVSRDEGCINPVREGPALLKLYPALFKAEDRERGLSMAVRALMALHPLTDPSVIGAVEANPFFGPGTGMEDEDGGGAMMPVMPPPGGGGAAAAPLMDPFSGSAWES